MKYPIALIAAAVVTISAHAQREHTPPTPAQMAQHEVSRYTTLLSLTAEQEAQATIVFTEEATTVQPLRTSERTSHKTLETAVKDGDMGLIQSTATALGTVSGEMMAAHAIAEAKFYATLTADQKTKFEALHHGFHGGEGHGGPGGPPPRPRDSSIAVGPAFETL